MKRGDLYLVSRGSPHDPKKQRVYLVVSRDEGLKHDSAVFCDALASIRKCDLTNYIGTLSDNKMREINTALRTALAIR